MRPSTWPKNFFVLWGPVVFWCAVIFTFSSIPTITTTKIIWWDFVLKKTAHMIEFGILYYLIYRALTKKFRSQSREVKIGNSKLKINFALSAFLFALFYALTDEYHQKFIPGRHCKLMDIGFDSLGMFISHWRINKS